MIVQKETLQSSWTCAQARKKDINYLQNNEQQHQLAKKILRARGGNFDFPSKFSWIMTKVIAHPKSETCNKERKWKFIVSNKSTSNDLKQNFF